MVLVDPEYLKDRKVYAHVLAAFRYGREDLDVLGLAFRKDLFLASSQVYPPVIEDTPKPLTHLQERLIKKLGANAYPFFFEVSDRNPSSLTIFRIFPVFGVFYLLFAIIFSKMDHSAFFRIIHTSWSVYFIGYY